MWRALWLAGSKPPATMFGGMLNSRAAVGPGEHDYVYAQFTYYDGHTGEVRRYSAR
jgi:hypothetical protein